MHKFPGDKEVKREEEKVARMKINEGQGRTI